MPKITEERRAARHLQILDAARACLQEHGLESVSMEMIIARSGLSAGGVYGHFRGKDEIMYAVVLDGMADLGRLIGTVLANPEPPPLPELMGQVLGVIEDFGQRRDGIDRLLVALHGWSHSLSDPALKEAAQVAYPRLRELFAETVRRGQAAGTYDPHADPEALAQLLTSVCLGYVAQRALAGGAGPRVHAVALAALTRAPRLTNHIP